VEETGGSHVLFELAVDDVGEDLELAMGMGSKASPGGDPVFVDHAQTAEGVVGVVVVRGEAEGVEGLQPVAE
jgi:hypothetical protein